MASVSVASRTDARNRVRAFIMAAVLGVPALAGKTHAKEVSDYVDDAKNYVLAPLHWDERDWAWFAGTVAAVAAAHHYDDNVRAHFHPQGLDNSDPHSLRDIAPAAALTGAVVLQGLFGDETARSTGFDMIESAAFAGGTSYALKFATGRERPDQTPDSGQWFKGGGSFPSTHAAVAFAVATSFAERDSDNPWARRVVAYGMASATAYLRLKDNQHWLSDTVAGAAIGVSTGLFVNHRALGTVHSAGNWSLSRVGDGIGISYVHELH